MRSILFRDPAKLEEFRRVRREGDSYRWSLATTKQRKKSTPTKK